MPLSPTGALLLVGAGVGLVVVVRAAWVWGRRYHAPVGFFGVLALATAAWMIVATGVVIGALHISAIIIPSFAIFAVVMLGRRLVPLLGGFVGKRELLRAHTEIGDLARRSDQLTRTEFEALRRKIVQLKRYRNPETAAFVDAAQSMWLDWADQQPVDPEELEARRQHVLALGDELFLGGDA